MCLGETQICIPLVLGDFIEYRLSFSVFFLCVLAKQKHGSVNESFDSYMLSIAFF